MICGQLSTISSFSLRGLEIGSRMQEYSTYDYTLSDKELNAIREGRDRAICHLILNGNGFAEPPTHYDIHEISAFDIGVTQERRDLRSMLVWSRDLNQCKADMKKGAK